MLGLQQPGRYYFLTLTSSPQSPPVEKSWPNLQKWLKREYGALPYVQILTREGFGVIHMVIRLRARQKNIDIKAVRKYWEESHRAKVVDIRRVNTEKQKIDLANYLSDQRKLRRMGAEMAWQPQIIKWGWSAGWIPVGFTKQYGRFWHEFTEWCIPVGYRDMVLHNWIQKCHKNKKDLKKMLPAVKQYPCSERPKKDDMQC